MSSQLGKRPVVSASPRFSLLYKVFRGLAGHARIVPGKGARVARTVGQFSNEGVPEA
jgi:hypothetical protein